MQIVTNASSYTTAQGYRYIGWENALREFRNMFAQRSSVRYWMITFFTFAIQGLICIESAVYLFLIKERPDKIGIYLFLSFIIYVACVVLLIFRPLLHQLYHGSYTYSENEIRWLQILRPLQNRPLSSKQKKRNRKFSRIRAKVERMLNLYWKLRRKEAF